MMPTRCVCVLDGCDSHTDALIGLVQDTPVTMDEWHRWRAIMVGSVEADEVKRGLRRCL